MRIPKLTIALILLLVIEIFFVFIHKEDAQIYIIETTECNSGKKDTIHIKAPTKGQFTIQTRNEAVPVLYNDELPSGDRLKLNVCGFRILKTYPAQPMY